MEIKLKLLKKVGIFSYLHDDYLRLFAKIANYRSYDKDKIILRENDTKDPSIFLIAKGQVKVFVSGIDGSEIVLAILNEGDFFGEMSLIDGEPRSASVKTLEKSELVVIHRDDFLNKLQNDFKLIMSLLKEMSRRIRRLDKQISALALIPVYGKIATTIMEIVKEKGTQTRLGDGTEVNVTYNCPSQQRIADLSGTTREEVSMAISYMQKKGFVGLNGTVLYVFQKPLLKI